MIGNFHGPGGRFGIKLLVLNLFPSFSKMNKKIMKVNSIGKEKNWSSMIVEN